MIRTALSYGQTKQSKQTQKIRTELQAKQDARTQLARDKVAAAVTDADDDDAGCALTQEEYDKQMAKLTKDILALEKKEMKYE